MTSTSTPPSTKRPAPQKLLIRTAHRELVAANFQIPAAILSKRVPKGLELDYYNDETYVSLVCMIMRNITFLGVPMTRRFAQLSLRFYVRHPSDPENRKGACCIKNYVSNPTAAMVLSSKFECEYDKLKMKWNNSGFNTEGSIPEVEYQWKVEDHWNKLRIRARSQIKNTGPSTKVGFILDHTTHYQHRDRHTYEYQVERPKWTVWDAAQANFTCDVGQLFGKCFVSALARRPASVFVTRGSEVSFFKPTLVQ